MHDHNFKIEDWPFDSPISTAVYTTKQVMEQDYPIHLICHDHEGEWQFLCGTTNAADDCMIVCMGCIFEKFPYLSQLSHLQKGWQAWKEDEDYGWIITEMDSDEDDE